LLFLPPLSKEGWGGFEIPPLNPPFSKGEVGVVQRGK